MDTIIKDPIHGSMQMHPLCLKIIDTPQFQRLRNIKQIGTTCFVYPGASHSRFGHSIGVCHLTGMFLQILKANQPDLDIDDKDVLCLKIAGLCHDLGHGPFSHLFEKIVAEIRDNEMEEEWRHEKASFQMLDHLIAENNLDKEFQKYGLHEEDKIFIKCLIHKDPKEDAVTRQEKTGRSNDKEYLYQIVANDTNGLDVDKWEYFARDCYMLGISNNFDHQRCMQLARVMEVKGQKQICFRDKERFDLIEMYHSRYTLHKRACKHKTGLIIDIMIIDAVKEANAHYQKFAGSTFERDGKLLTISEAVDDMKAYTKLTDDVLNDIGHSTDPSLKPSRDIIDRINKRDLYKCIYRKTITTGYSIGQINCELYLKAGKLEVNASLSDGICNQIKTGDPIGQMTCEIYHDLNGGEPTVKTVLSDDMFEHIKENEKLTEENIKSALMKQNPKLPENDFIIKIAKFDYGKGHKDPIDNVTFFDKEGKIVEPRTQGGRVRLNQLICEWDILVIYKRSNIDETVDVEDEKNNIKKAFEEYSKQWI